MFHGFSNRTADFFWGVRLNNRREWLAENKQAYLDDALTPLRELGSEIYDGMAARFPALSLQLHISRIYRDARRMGTRGPLKDNMWFSVFEQSDSRTTHPEFYFDVGADDYSFGLGVWDSQPAAMQRFRESVMKNPKQLTQLVTAFQKQDVFALCGEDYAKSKGEVAPLLVPWFQKKRLYFQCARPYDDIVCSREIVTQLLDGFTFLMPYCQYFSQI